MGRLRRAAALHGWWLGAAAVVAVVVSVTTGWWLLPVYAFVNAAGTLFYLDGLPGRPARARRRLVPLMAVALIPVGFLMLSKRRGLEPSEIATSASPSDDHRRGTAGIQMGATLGPGGRTGGGA